MVLTHHTSVEIFTGSTNLFWNYVSGGGTPYNVVYVGVYAGEYIAASGPPTTYFGNYVSTATYLGGPEGFEPYFGTATYLGNYVGQPGTTYTGEYNGEYDRSTWVLPRIKGTMLETMSETTVVPSKVRHTKELNLPQSQDQHIREQHLPRIRVHHIHPPQPLIISATT